MQAFLLYSLKCLCRAAEVGHEVPSLKQAVAENEAYIAGETQAVAIKWAASADGLEANEADGEAFSFTTVKA